MIKLFNLSTHPMDLSKFKNSSSELEKFLQKHQLNGVEVIQSGEWKEEVLSSKLIKGLHMRYWPVWLDFWKENTAGLEKMFESKEICTQFYGGASRKDMVEYYKNELDAAQAMGVEYVVFHVANVEPEHCFTYDFTYSDSEVVNCSVELLNEVFYKSDWKFDLLFENLWWPGLTLLDRGPACELMERVEYPHKGFMMDISHLMNTNMELKSEAEGVEYILQIVERLGNISSHIKGIHLNSSLSGAYVKESIKNMDRCIEGGFFDRYIHAYKHILNIDRHVPFIDTAIRKVISCIKPEYLVYEFLTEDFDMLDKYISIQNNVVG